MGRFASDFRFDSPLMLGKGVNRNRERSEYHVHISLKDHSTSD